MFCGSKVKQSEFKIIRNLNADLNPSKALTSTTIKHNQPPPIQINTHSQQFLFDLIAGSVCFSWFESSHQFQQHSSNSNKHPHLLQKITPKQSNYSQYVINMHITCFDSFVWWRCCWLHVVFQVFFITSIFFSYFSSSVFTVKSQPLSHYYCCYCWWW